MRFLKLPDKEWQPIEDYLKSGKPVIGLRTANHSFKYAEGSSRATSGTTVSAETGAGHSLHRSPVRHHTGQRR